MKKEDSKESIKKISPSSLFIEAWRKEEEQRVEIAKRISNHVVKNYKEIIKETDKTIRSAQAKKTRDYRTIELISNLDTKKFAKKILKIINEIDVSNNYDTPTPYILKKNIEFFKNYLNHALDKLQNRFTREYLYQSMGPEIVDLRKSINAVLDLIAKLEKNPKEVLDLVTKVEKNTATELDLIAKIEESPKEFLRRRDRLYVPSNAREIDFRKNKELAIICINLNGIFKETHNEKLRTFALAIMAGILIYELNNESEKLNLQNIPSCKNSDLLEKIREIKRSKSWKSRI